MCNGLLQCRVLLPSFELGQDSRADARARCSRTGLIDADERRDTCNGFRVSEACAALVLQGVTANPQVLLRCQMLHGVEATLSPRS